MPRRSKAPSASQLPANSTTGAVSKASAVKEVVCPAAPRRTPSSAATGGHQTHGSVTPLTGPITNIGQLINRGANVAKGSAGSFSTLVEYTAYLRNLTVHELHSHAVHDARIVPIDDRERLIRRLETQWTTTAARQAGGRAATIPARQPFTQEQIEAQNEIRRKLTHQ